MTKNSARKPSKAEREILRQTMGLSSKRDIAARKELKDLKTFTSARFRAGRRLRDKITKQALSAAGIDINLAAKQQEIDRRTVAKFIAKQEREAVATARQVNRGQAASTTARLEQLDRISPQDVVVQQLRVANNIQVSRQLEPGESTSTNPQQNLARIGQRTTGFGDNLLTVRWHFVWTPPQFGLLKVISSLLSNGFGYIRTDPPWLVRGYTSVIIDTMISIYQGPLITPESTPYVSSPRFTIWEEKLDDSGVDCVGRYSSRRVDDQISLVLDEVAVRENTPVDIVIEVKVGQFTWHGDANVNFMTGDFALNVPFVYVILS